MNRTTKKNTVLDRVSSKNFEFSAWVMALEDSPGIGRRTAARILHYFPDYETLLTFPVDQIQARLKRTPKATEIRNLLLNESEMRRRIQQATETLTGFKKSGIEVVSSGSPLWPDRISDLPSSLTPNLLYLFGQADLLGSRSAGFFADPPLNPAVFERSQESMKFVLESGSVLASGLHSGFDTVAVKLSVDRDAPTGSIMVVNRGLGQVEGAFRSSALLSLRAGGVLVSSFRPDHGPFPHDDRERCFLQAALSDIVIVCDPKMESYAVEALLWSKSIQKPVFVIVEGEVPVALDDVHRLNKQSDLAWLQASLNKFSGK